MSYEKREVTYSEKCPITHTTVFAYLKLYTYVYRILEGHTATRASRINGKVGPEIQKALLLPG